MTYKKSAGNYKHEFISNTVEKIMGGIQIHEKNVVIRFPL